MWFVEVLKEVSVEMGMMLSLVFCWRLSLSMRTSVSPRTRTDDRFLLDDLDLPGHIYLLPDLYDL